MKRVLALLSLVVYASVATAQPLGLSLATVGPNGATTQTANHASANFPTAAGDGISVQGMSSCVVIVSAASGQTLSGAGTIRIWYYESGHARWAENMDVFSSQGVSAKRDAVTQAFTVGTKSGRLYAEARSVTSSSGALTVKIGCWR